MFPVATHFHRFSQIVRQFYVRLTCVGHMPQIDYDLDFGCRGGWRGIGSWTDHGYSEMRPCDQNVCLLQRAW